MKDLISRIQRELPDTDKDRYDAAYARGQAQARSGLLFGGLAFGALLGAAVMFLFDPNRGADRRAQLASRMTGIRGDLQNRAKEVAVEAGYQQPEEGVPAHASTRGTGQRVKRSNGTPVAVLTGPGDWESAEREAQQASEGHGAG